MNVNKVNYRVELEFYNVHDGKKKIQEKTLDESDNIEPFKESVAKSENIGIMYDSGLILTAIRIYKGAEIVYDKYCVGSDLNSLRDLLKSQIDRKIW